MSVSTFLADLEAFLEALHRTYFATLGEQVVATVLTGAALFVLTAAVERAGGPVKRRLSDRFDPLVEAVQAVLVTGLTGLWVVTLVVVWGATATVFDAVSAATITGETVVRVVVTGGVLLGAYVLAQGAKGAIERFYEDRAAISEHQREIAAHLADIGVYAFALLVVLALWEVDLDNLLVGAGFLGIVLGLAARQTLGAVLAGFVLLFARPFEVGDWVVVDDREGVVTDVTIFNTQLRTVNDEYVMLPNDLVTGSSVVNRSRRGQLRVDVEVGVDYETDLERAADLAREVLRDLEETLSVPEPKVVLKRFGDSAVVLELRFWIDKPSARRLWEARTAAIREVKAAFDAEDVKIPFPQRELAGREEAGGLRVAGETLAGPRETATDGRGTDGAAGGADRDGAADADDGNGTRSDEEGDGR